MLPCAAWGLGSSTARRATSEIAKSGHSHPVATRARRQPVNLGDNTGPAFRRSAAGLRPPVPKVGRPYRTGFGARGRLALTLAFVAHAALAHTGQAAGPFVDGNQKNCHNLPSF